MAAAVVDGLPVARLLRLDPELRFVVVVPDRELSTSSARDVLPPTVPHEDAAFNLGRLGLLIAGLADHSQLLATPVTTGSTRGRAQRCSPRPRPCWTGCGKRGRLRRAGLVPARACSGSVPPAKLKQWRGRPRL